MSLDLGSRGLWSKPGLLIQPQWPFEGLIKALIALHRLLMLLMPLAALGTQQEGWRILGPSRCFYTQPYPRKQSPQAEPFCGFFLTGHGWPKEPENYMKGVHQVAGSTSSRIIIIVLSTFSRKVTFWSCACCCSHWHKLSLLFWGCANFRKDGFSSLVFGLFLFSLPELEPSVLGLCCFQER